VTTATADFLALRRELPMLRSAAAVAAKFPKRTFNFIKGGATGMSQKLEQFKEYRKPMHELDLLALGYGHSANETGKGLAFHQFIARIVALLDTSIQDTRSLDDFEQQLSNCCSDIIAGKGKEFCSHFGALLVDEFWKLQKFSGDEFLAHVPPAVQLAKSFIDSRFTEAPGKKKVGDDSKNGKEKVHKEARDQKVKHFPGFIPPETYKEMSDKEIGKYLCPYQKHLSTCTNTKCKFSHDPDAPMYRA
jgi:hypothetical protein